MKSEFDRELDARDRCWILPNPSARDLIRDYKIRDPDAQDRLRLLMYELRCERATESVIHP